MYRIVICTLLSLALLGKSQTADLTINDITHLLGWKVNKGIIKKEVYNNISSLELILINKDGEEKSLGDFKDLLRGDFHFREDDEDEHLEILIKIDEDKKITKYLISIADGFARQSVNRKIEHVSEPLVYAVYNFKGKGLDENKVNSIRDSSVMVGDNEIASWGYSMDEEDKSSLILRVTLKPETKQNPNTSTGG